MFQSRGDMRKTVFLIGLTLAILGASIFWWSTGSGSSGHAMTSDPSASANSARSVSDAGHTPVGSPTAQGAQPQPAPAEPLPDPLRQEVDQLTSRDDSGLVEEPLPGGGVQVNLQGRFRSVPYATMDEDGRVTIAE
ncbi:hypothetical protein QQM79_07410 [Marinobacteraceae bacterium S3BR75-40.1]